MKKSLFRNTTALALCVALAAPLPVVAQQGDGAAAAEDQQELTPEQLRKKLEEEERAREQQQEAGAPAAGGQENGQGRVPEQAPWQQKREERAEGEAPEAAESAPAAEAAPEGPPEDAPRAEADSTGSAPLSESGDPDDIRATGEQVDITEEAGTDMPVQGGGDTPEADAEQAADAPEEPTAEDRQADDTQTAEQPADAEAGQPAVTAGNAEAPVADDTAEAEAEPRREQTAAPQEDMPVQGGSNPPEETAEAPAPTEQERVEREVEITEQRQEQRRASDALLEDAEAAQVQEETVTEENARASNEEFGTSVNETVAPAMQPAPQQAEGRDDGNQLIDTLAKAALAGLGAYAVGSILDNGDEVVSNSGDRVVVQRDGQYVVLKDDDTLLRQPGNAVRTETFNDGSTRSTVTRQDGSQVVTIRAADGTVLQRTRVLPDGRQVVLFDDTQRIDEVRVEDLPRPREQVIEYRDTDTAALERALAREAGVNRRFSLSQVRDISAVRALVPEISVDQINFETGSAVIRPEEAQALAALGRAMRDMIAENPSEVFLVEGHTDAVGRASYNLALSDRRAESLALALTEYFEVPPENMIVQGYGESDLKIETQDDERANRRAAVRRITPLLQNG